MWIQSGVTVRKPLSWVLTSVTLTFDLWPWTFAWTSLWSLVITPENFMMMPWGKHSEKGVTDGRTDRQTENTIHRAAWSQLKIHVATKMVALWNSHTMKQSMTTRLLSHPTMAHIELSKGSDLKTSSLPLRCHLKLNCQVCHLCYHTIRIHTNIYCSVIFPVLSPINVENPHN